MKNYIIPFFVILLIQCCKKEEKPLNDIDRLVGTYKCSGTIYGFRGADPRDTSNVIQSIEVYSESFLILKYSLFNSGFEAVDTVIFYQDSFLKQDKAFLFDKHFGNGSGNIHCIDGMLKNDSIFISYRYAGCLNPSYSYIIKGPKIK